MIEAAVVTGYLSIVAAMGVVEFYAVKRPESIAPMGDMLEHVMRSRTVRVGIIAAWWWFGWHFLFAPTVQVAL
jgi:hypothetical protein